MAVKIVALDIYGTILASNDYENNFQVRNGLKQFFQHCENKDARVVSASDSLLARSDISELIKKPSMGRLRLFTERILRPLLLTIKPQRI